MLRNALKVLPLLALCAAAHAQTAGTVTLTANKTSASGSLVPVLTWSTSPVATSCTASGGWSGTKFASGSETLPKITASKSYTLTCSWGNGTANVSWTIPTTNTDGSKLTDLKGFNVHFGTSKSALTQSLAVNSATATSATVPALASGTWYFSVRAVNSKGIESLDSNIASKTISAATAAKTVSITITPTTTKKLVTTGTTVYDVLYTKGTRQLGRTVGTVALGVACNPDYPTNTNYFPVLRSLVKFTRESRSNTVVARCAWK
ncbi:MAG TPA: fibronectin type III domain-containing protein [Steroidobacteraceae bacterium]|jgi:hypothetical protein|nr:fibronectin type III domain-containing protein [Steroidobacteraceae bacterium]